MLSTGQSISTQTQPTRGIYHRIRPLLYETGLQLNPSRVQASDTLPSGRVSTVHLPYSVYLVKPHHVPPEPRFVRHPVASYIILTPINLGCQALRSGSPHCPVAIHHTIATGRQKDMPCCSKQTKNPRIWSW